MDDRARAKDSYYSSHPIGGLTIERDGYILGFEHGVNEERSRCAQLALDQANHATLNTSWDKGYRCACEDISVKIKGAS